MKRVFLIVLDSVGAGFLPDAASFGDEGANTLKTVSASPFFKADNMRSLGLGNIDGLDFLVPVENPRGAYGKIAEASAGKDTTIGHWEIAGVISKTPLPTYPNGFPKEILDEFTRQTGRGVLCNKPYSGTEVIKDYGEEHLKTGALIVYTSADSVFQIAAHEDLVPPEKLYEYCRIARKILTGKHGVGRVIARPFIGKPGSFTRTANRHDFSIDPPAPTLLDAISGVGKDVIAVGKITDIFNKKGVTESIFTHGNAEGMQVTLDLGDRDFDGLCFVNLVDFDMLYGHRNDIEGYAKALTAFDTWLPSFLQKLGDEDMLFITADHGCDPGYPTTDHTREYIPLLVYGKHVAPVNLGVGSTYSSIAATIAEYLGVDFKPVGKSFLSKINK